MRTDAITRDFETWWHNEGSGILPRKNDDMESHAHRVARLAWKRATYKAEESYVAECMKEERL
jgi:hypothetical protein